MIGDELLKAVAGQPARLHPRRPISSPGSAATNSPSSRPPSRQPTDVIELVDADLRGDPRALSNASAISSPPTPASASRWRRSDGTDLDQTAQERRPGDVCAPRPTGAAPIASSSRRWMRASRRAACWSWICARRSPTAASSSTTSRCVNLAGRRDHRLRGAAALAPSRARHDLAGRIHPGRRGDRPDRPARRMGADARPARRRPAGPDDVRLAVNVSPVQFKSGTLALKVVAALAASGLPPDRLELEITEAVLIRDDDAALADAASAARASACASRSTISAPAIPR